MKASPWLQFREYKSFRELNGIRSLKRALHVANITTSFSHHLAQEGILIHCLYFIKHLTKMLQLNEYKKTEATYGLI